MSGSRLTRKVTVEGSKQINDNNAPRKSVFDRLGPGTIERSQTRREDHHEPPVEKCRHWLRDGRCPFGSKCRYNHSSTSEAKSKLKIIRSIVSRQVDESGESKSELKVKRFQNQEGVSEHASKKSSKRQKSEKTKATKEHFKEGNNIKEPRELRKDKEDIKVEKRKEAAAVRRTTSSSGWNLHPDQSESDDGNDGKQLDWEERGALNYEVELEERRNDLRRQLAKIDETVETGFTIPTKVDVPVVQCQVTRAVEQHSSPPFHDDDAGGKPEKKKKAKSEKSKKKSKKKSHKSDSPLLHAEHLRAENEPSDRTKKVKSPALGKKKKKQENRNDSDPEIATTELPIRRQEYQKEIPPQDQAQARRGDVPRGATLKDQKSKARHSHEPSRDARLPRSQHPERHFSMESFPQLNRESDRQREKEIKFDSNVEGRNKEKERMKKRFQHWSPSRDGNEVSQHREERVGEARKSGTRRIPVEERQDSRKSKNKEKAKETTASSRPSDEDLNKVAKTVIRENRSSKKGKGPRTPSPEFKRGSASRHAGRDSKNETSVKLPRRHGNDVGAAAGSSVPASVRHSPPEDPNSKPLKPTRGERQMVEQAADENMSESSDSDSESSSSEDSVEVESVSGEEQHNDEGSFVSRNVQEKATEHFTTESKQEYRDVRRTDVMRNRSAYPDHEEQHIGDPREQGLKEPRERPSNEHRERPLNVSRERPLDEPRERPLDEPRERPLNEPRERPLNEPRERPLDEPRERPLNEPRERPLNEPRERPLNEPGERPLNDSRECPLNQPRERSLNDSRERPLDEPRERPLNEPRERPLDEPRERPLNEHRERPFNESRERPFNEPKERQLNEHRERPSNESKERSLNEPRERPLIEPKERPLNEPGERPLNEPRDRPLNEPVERPLNEHRERPLNEPRERPLNEPRERPLDKPRERPLNEPGERPSNEHRERPSNEHRERPLNEPRERPLDKPRERPLNEPRERSLNEAREHPLDEPHPLNEPGEERPLNEPRERPLNEPRERSLNEPRERPLNEPREERPLNEPRERPLNEPREERPLNEPRERPLSEPRERPLNEPRETDESRERPLDEKYDPKERPSQHDRNEERGERYHRERGRDNRRPRDEDIDRRADNRYSKDTREMRDIRDVRDHRDPRDERDTRDHREFPRIDHRSARDRERYREFDEREKERHLPVDVRRNEAPRTRDDDRAGYGEGSWGRDRHVRGHSGYSSYDGRGKDFEERRTEGRPSHEYDRNYDRERELHAKGSRYREGNERAPWPERRVERSYREPERDRFPESRERFHEDPRAPRTNKRPPRTSPEGNRNDRKGYREEPERRLCTPPEESEEWDYEEGHSPGTHSKDQALSSRKRPKDQPSPRSEAPKRKKVGSPEQVSQDPPRSKEKIPAASNEQTIDPKESEKQHEKESKKSKKDKSKKTKKRKLSEDEATENVDMPERKRTKRDAAEEKSREKQVKKPKTKNQPEVVVRPWSDLESEVDVSKGQGKNEKNTRETTGQDVTAGATVKGGEEKKDAAVFSDWSDASENTVLTKVDTAESKEVNEKAPELITDGKDEKQKKTTDPDASLDDVYDPISDDEFEAMFAGDEEQTVIKKKTTPLPVDEVDWSILGSSVTKKESVPGDYIKRFSAGKVFSRIGLSSVLAGAALTKLVKEKCAQDAPDMEMKDLLPDGSGKKSTLGALVAAEARNMKKRSNVVSDIGPCRRALCARRDFYIRKQLRKLTSTKLGAKLVLSNSAVEPVDNELFAMSVSLFQRRKSELEQETKVESPLLPERSLICT